MTRQLWSGTGSQLKRSSLLVGKLWCGVVTGASPALLQVPAALFQRVPCSRGVARHGCSFGSVVLWFCSHVRSEIGHQLAENGARSRVRTSIVGMNVIAISDVSLIISTNLTDCFRFQTGCGKYRYESKTDLYANYKLSRERPKHRISRRVAIATNRNGNGSAASHLLRLALCALTQSRGRLQRQSRQEGHLHCCPHPPPPLVAIYMDSSPPKPQLFL
jgi:hypothetical protein